MLLKICWNFKKNLRNECSMKKGYMVMHVCQIASSNTAPLAWDLRVGPVLEQHHHLTLFYRSWCIRGSPLISCGKGMCWTPHGWTWSGSGENPTIHGFSPIIPQGCILIDRSTLLSSFQRAVRSIYREWLAFLHIWHAALFHSSE